MADSDTQTAPKPPPNLRVATDEKEECDSCAHYERGKCALYNNLPVDGEWVCDSYKKDSDDADNDSGAAKQQPKAPAASDDGKDDPGDRTPTAPSAKSPTPKNLREAEREAFVRVRAHNRRARQDRAGANAGKPGAQERLK